MSLIRKEVYLGGSEEIYDYDKNTVCEIVKGLIKHKAIFTEIKVDNKENEVF